jgi:hypothetical protein
MTLLVIVSRDYGELSVAKYFLAGLETVPAPVMLVPASLGQPEGIEGGVEARNYRTFADIRRAVEEIQPDTALLFSGYLLAIGTHFSLLNAFRLFSLLRRRRVSIITSDPFIGLLQGPRSLRFREMLRLRKKDGPGFVASIVAPLLALRTYLIHWRLRRHWHIYPAPVVHRFLAADHRGLSFYNASAVPGPAQYAMEPDAAPFWLFVLSEVEFCFQTNRRGGVFVEHLAARLRDAARPGRRVVMIGPGDLLVDLRRRISGTPGIELRDTASHGEYMRLLLQAERVFFWNYYSFSVLHRVLSDQPVHYFDEGHMVSILPGLGQIGIDTFYGGWRPPLLSLEEPLDEARIEQVTDETRENFARIRARIETGLSPRSLLARAAAPSAPAVNE